MSQSKPKPKRKPANPSMVPGGQYDDVDLSKVPWSDPSQRGPIVLLALLTLGLVAIYFDMFGVCRLAWDSDQYSHGWLIPLGTLVMLYVSAKKFTKVPSSERWIGIGLILLGMIIRLFSGFYYFVPLGMWSFIPAILGIFTLVGGLRTLRWAGPWLAFSVFMFPLPSFIENRFLWKLKQLGTIISNYTLQTIGFAAHRTGNVIYIDGTELNVADACSGLRMATIFIAMGVGLALLIERPWWDKLIIILSTIPIALFVNMVRITTTAILYWAYPERQQDTEGWFKVMAHDVPGYAMPILALGLLFLLMSILEKLAVEEGGGDMTSLGMGGAKRKAAGV